MLDLPVLCGDALSDRPLSWPVRQHVRMQQWYVFALDSDLVVSPTGQEMSRTYLAHPGAVAVIALDEDDHVVVIQQYRHPVRSLVVEPPAGLRDEPGESTLTTGARELAEEVGLQARWWRTLVDYQPSSGASSEGIRILLARDLSPVGRPDGFVLAGEEVDMPIAKVAVEVLLEAALAGKLACSTLVLGVMALEVARRRGSLDDLRPADAPWFQNPKLTSTFVTAESGHR